MGSFTENDVFYDTDRTRCTDDQFSNHLCEGSMVTIQNQDFLEVIMDVPTIVIAPSGSETETYRVQWQIGEASNLDHSFYD